jgi:hypothetical protein
MVDMELWQPHRIEQDQCLEAQVGPLQLWLRRSGDEIRIATKQRRDPESRLKAVPLHPAAERKPAGLDWSRWVCGSCEQVLLMPVTPHRPVVVRPEVPLKIPPGREALFFFGLPLWVRITVGDTKKVQLCEEPSVTVSNIWFGDPMSGDLCYSLRTRARRWLSDDQIEQHRAVCPVTICNAAPVQVDIERFCVHVAHLSIYPGISRLWTGGVQITFKGEDEISQVEYSENPPTYEEVDKVLSKPRLPVKKSIFKKSISSLGLFNGV